MPKQQLKPKESKFKPKESQLNPKKSQSKPKESPEKSANVKSPLVSVLWKIQKIIPFNILTPSLAFFVLKCLIIIAVVFSAFEKKNVQKLIEKWIDHQNTSVVENVHLDTAKVNDSNVTSQLNTLSQKIQKTIESEFKEKHFTKSESTILSILTNPNNWLFIIPTLTIVSVYFRRLQLKQQPSREMVKEEAHPMVKVEENPMVEVEANRMDEVKAHPMDQPEDFKSKLHAWLSTENNETSESKETSEKKDNVLEMHNLFQNIYKYYVNTEDIIRKNFEGTTDDDILKLKEKMTSFKQAQEESKKNPTKMKLEMLLRTIMTLNSIILFKYALLE